MRYEEYSSIGWRTSQYVKGVRRVHSLFLSCLFCHPLLDLTLPDRLLSRSSELILPYLFPFSYFVFVLATILSEGVEHLDLLPVYDEYTSFGFQSVLRCDLFW